jgi:surface carbohydrate biosynthesis protein (TIGR04326 family)
MFEKNYIKQILIDDGDKAKSKKILWNSYKSSLDEISLLNYIDLNSEEIKSNYINIIESLSKIQMNSKTKLSDCFSIKNDFSLWWTTHIFEKSFYKQETINDVLKLIALKKLLIQNNTKNLYLESNSNKISKGIIDICNQLKINLIFQKKIIAQKNFLNLKRILKFFLPYPIFSFFNFIKFLSIRFLLKKNNINKLKNLDKKYLFCTYFAYIDYKKLKKGLYSCDYWNQLIKNKQDQIKSSIFLHIYVPNNKTNLRKSIKYFESINKKKEIFHLFIEELFDVKILIKIIKQWLIYLFTYKKEKKKIYNLLNNKIHTSHLFKEELKQALIGTDALVNLYYFFLFEKLSKLIKEPKKTFYLFENQGWEKSFVYNFKKIKTNTIAVIHATIRYWDLRFSYNDRPEYQNFLPDFYTANGDDAYEKLITANFPINKIKKLEALRYINLVTKISKRDFSKNFKKNKVLIIGDHLKESNKNLSVSLNLINLQSAKNFSFTLKEHPLTKMSHLLKVEFDKTEKDIFDLSDEFNIAIVGNTTSAIVDLYLLGFKIISILDDNQINLSPLKKNSDIFFLKDKSLLLDYLSKPDNIKELKSKKNNFFYSSKKFNMWDEILNYE